MSTFMKIMEFMELSEGIGFGKANKAITALHKKMLAKNLVHLGNIYYGPEGGPATHKKNDTGTDFIPLTDKEKKEANNPTADDPSTPKNKIDPKKPKSVAQKNNQPNVPVSKTPLADSVVQMHIPPKKQTDKQKTALRQADAGKSQNAMNITKAQLKALSKEEKKGNGLGTPASRAGEAVVTNLMRDVIIHIKSNNLTGDEASKYARDYFKNSTDQLSEMIQDGKHILDKKWLTSSIIILNQLSTMFDGRLDDIDEIAWDTPHGRQLIGSQDHNTSSDFFIKMKHGGIIGLSLKKNGQVQMRNMGLTDFANELIVTMRKNGLSEKEATKILYEISGDKKNSRYAKDISNAAFQAQQAFRTGPFGKEANIVINKLLKGEIKEDSNNQIVDRLRAMHKNGTLTDLFNKNPTSLTEDETKVLQRLCQYMQGGKFSKEAYLLNRSFFTARDNLSERFLEVLNSNTMMGDNVKDRIIGGMHLYEILGLEFKNKLDMKLMVFYGDPGAPEAHLSEETLMKLFNSANPNFSKFLFQAKNAATEKGRAAAFAKLDRVVKETISMDFTGSKGRGIVKYNRTNPTPPPALLSYTIFTLEVRVKGIGKPPEVAITQKPGFIYALTYGTEVKNWPRRARNDYYKGEYTGAMERLMSALPGTSRYKLNLQEMESLRSNIDMDDKLFDKWVQKTKLDIENSNGESDNE